MKLNKEELINKIIYRSSYRGSKEIYILMTSFVKSLFFNIDIKDLLILNNLVNLDDEILKKIKNGEPTDLAIEENNIITKFRKF